MKAEQNDLITRIGPGTPCGAVMRRYWQPAALVDEFNPRLDPRMAQRPIKAVRLLGQDLVLFRDAKNRWGLLDRDCPHRGADLSFGRLESAAEGASGGDGLRCPFHGWKFAVDGTCTETPAEPVGSKLCERVRQRSYPVVERGGVVFAYLGPEGSEPPPFPGVRLLRGTGHAHLCLQGPVERQLAAGVRGGHRPRASVLPAPLFARRTARRHRRQRGRQAVPQCQRWAPWTASPGR